MSLATWKEDTYSRIFREHLVGLEKMRAAKPSLRKEELEGILAHLYVKEGNDMDGRGELGDITVQATIAAYESFLAEWKDIES